MKRWWMISGILLTFTASSNAFADSGWVRDERGRCVRAWSASELARGPTAMTNGVLLPFRAFAGGVSGGAWGVLLSPGALVAGAVEGLTWVASGLLDTFSAGALAVSPDGISELQTAPVIQFPEGERSYDAYNDEPGCPDVWQNPARLE